MDDLKDRIARFRELREKATAGSNSKSNRATADFITAAANDALPLLADCQQRIEELTDSLKQANANMEEVERSLYLRIGELEKRAEDLEREAKRFKSDGVPVVIRDLIVDRIEAENRKLREACEMYMELQKRDCAECRSDEDGVCGEHTSARYRLLEAMEAVLTDKGGE